MGAHKIRTVFFHAGFWIVYIAVNSIINRIARDYYGDAFYLSDQLAKYFCAIAFFYYTVFIFFAKAKVAVKIILYVAGVFGYHSLFFLIYAYILPGISNYPKLSLSFDIPIIINGLWWWIHYTIYAYFFWLYIKNTERIHALGRLRSQNLEARYNFLKAQINPHFLYNTLSLFYTRTVRTDKETAEGISLLTDLMRYSLQEGNSNGKVLLRDEVTHLTSYIQLQQMRFGNTLNIQFNMMVEKDDFLVLPHVLITIVENAFKHGEVNNPQHPLQINLLVKENRFFFSVYNKIRSGLRDLNNTGIGVSNICERLKMEYGEALQFIQTSDDHFYNVSLSLPVELLTSNHGESNIKRKKDNL